MGARVGDITFISNEWVINDYLIGNIPEWATPGFETLLFGNIMAYAESYSGEYG